MAEGSVDVIGAEDGIADDDDVEVVGFGTELDGMCMNWHGVCRVASSAIVELVG